MRINSIVIDFFSNSFREVLLPDSAEIIDMVFCNDYRSLKIIYQDKEFMDSINNRHYNIHIINDGSLSGYLNLNDNCKYFKYLQLNSTIIDLNTTNLGKIYPNWSNYEYYIFIEKIKTIPEVRDDKINSII